tara:strand:+ start:50 stop:331 length:282 start_codon:yes stop_codon:yes gene_type:complete
LRTGKFVVSISDKQINDVSPVVMSHDIWISSDENNDKKENEENEKGKEKECKQSELCEWDILIPQRMKGQELFCKCLFKVSSFYTLSALLLAV